VIDLLMQLGLSYRFGKSVNEQKQEREEKAKEDIATAVRETTKFYESELSNQSRQHETEINAINARLDETIEEINQKYDQDIAVLKAKGEEYEADKIKLEEEKKAAIDLAEQKAKEAIDLAEQEKEEGIARAERERDVAIRNIENRFGQEKDELVAAETFKSENYSRGVQALADGNYQQALESFEAVAETDSEYLEVQEYIELTKAATKSWSEYPPEVREIYTRGVDLFAQKKYEEAITEWKKILEDYPYNKAAKDGIKQAEDRLKKLKELGARE
ncbi:MAG: hypothetical protein JSV25_09995, partial [Spirochaetota bacterium]